MYIGKKHYIHYQKIHRYAETHPPTAFFRLKTQSSRIMPEVLPVDKRQRSGDILFPS